MGVNDDASPLGDILANTVWMRRLAQTLVADAAERDEVVQAVWLQALLHAPATQNLRPWLAAVLRNVVRMGFRGDARRRAREQAAIGAPPPVTPEELVDRVEIERDVASALLELGEPYRATLLLRYYEDLSAAEIAARLAIPAATVRSRLKRGLAELRARLDAKSGGDRRRWAVALVPTAAAARMTTAKTIALAIGGALMMKSAIKATVAAALLLLLGWGTAVVWRSRAPGNEVTRTRAGVAWHVAGGVGVPGQAPATVDGTSIPEWFGQPGAAIRRVAGRVTAGGAPIAGATVELGSALSDAGLLPAATRRTGADGRFDFGLVPPAPYSVTATAEQHSADVREVDTRDPGAAADRIELHLGSCDAQLVGHVNDASGGPIAGARLCYADVRASACVQSDASGAYRACLHPRQTKIEVSARGYGAVDEDLEIINRTVRRDFLLTPEATIVGRVVRADDGRPVANASVRSVSGAVGHRVAAPAAVVTDGNGHFALAGLAPGRHRLSAFATGLAMNEPLELNVRAAGTTPEIVLRLGAAARISGVVRDERGPVAGARVALGDTGPLRGGPPGATPVGGVDAVTQPDGSFVLEPVARGAVTVRVADWDVLAPKSLIVDRSALDGVTVTVSALGSIAGRVTRQGKPAPNVAIDVPVPGVPAPFVYSDADGSYIVHGLRAGKYVVDAQDRAHGFGALSPDIVLGPGEQRTGVDLECNYAGAISGVVVEDDGRPAAGVSVHFAAVHKVDVGEAITGTDGSFRAGTLGGNDDYRAEVHAGDDFRHVFAPADGSFPTVYVPNNESEVSGVRLVIHRTHQSITGITVGADGQPLSDVQVIAFRAGANADQRLYLDEFSTRPSAISGADGRFVIADVDDGTFVLRARAGDGAEGHVDGVAAGQQGVTVTMQASGGIDGQLVGFAAPPDVTARTNEVLVPAPPVWATVSGTSFQLRGLSSGNYIVYADGGGGHDAEVVRVDAGQIATVTLRDRGSGVVHGRVVEWRTGAPVEGLRCVPVYVTGNVRNTMHVDPGLTGSDGSFTIDGVARGPADIICGWSPDYSDGIGTVTVGEGDASCEIVVVKHDRPLGGLSWFGGEIFVPPAARPRIASVMPGGPADQAGVKRGDLLDSVDGRSVAKLSPIGDEFAIRDREPGSHVALGVVRGGKSLTLDVVLNGGPIP